MFADQRIGGVSGSGVAGCCVGWPSEGNLTCSVSTLGFRLRPPFTVAGFLRGFLSGLGKLL
jgi:hypothetical protein